MSTNRIKGRRAVEVRARFLWEHPLCSGPDSECEKADRVTTAMEVDHIIPVEKGGPDTDANKQGLCVPCHRSKTARDFGFKATKQAIGIDGWPI